MPLDTLLPVALARTEQHVARLLTPDVLEIRGRPWRGQRHRAGGFDGDAADQGGRSVRRRDADPEVPCGGHGYRVPALSQDGGRQILLAPLARSESQGGSATHHVDSQAVLVVLVGPCDSDFLVADGRVCARPEQRQVPASEPRGGGAGFVAVGPPSYVTVEGAVRDRCADGHAGDDIAIDHDAQCRVGELDDRRVVCGKHERQVARRGVASCAV